MSDTQATAAPPAKKSRGKLFLVVGVIVLRGGGGAGAWYVTRGGSDAAAEAGHEKPAPEVERGVVSFEPFIVNLADPGGQRFLRADIRLLVPEPEAAAHVQENAVAIARLRAAIIDVLTAQTAAAIAVPEGKAALKKTIAEQADAILRPTEVADVLFSDFVIQY
jgi:flagellar FliL protein